MSKLALNSKNLYNLKLCPGLSIENKVPFRHIYLNPKTCINKKGDSITFKRTSPPNIDYKKLATNIFGKFIQGMVDMVMPTSKVEVTNIYTKFKNECPDFIETFKKDIFSILAPLDAEKINSKPFFHATKQENVDDILKNGFDVFRTQPLKDLNPRDERIGTYARELGFGMYLSTSKMKHYGNGIIKAQPNVEHSYHVPQSILKNKTAELCDKMDRICQEKGLSLKERNIIINNSFVDLAQEKNIDCIYLIDDIDNGMHQLVVYDLNKIKLSAE